MRALLIALAAVAVAPGIVAGREQPLKVCLLSGSEEYHSDETLAAFRAYLEARYPARCTLLKAPNVKELPGLEALDDCDVAVFFTRRLTIDGDALAKVRAYVERGRPIVAIRTASHGFQNWLEFDKKYLGGNYQNHFRNDLSVRAKILPEAKAHPVLAGVGALASPGSLYKTAPLADDVTPLMTGTTPESTQPVAWVREVNGARIFYTSLGAQGDFENASFLRMIAQALFWAARRDIPEVARPTPAEPPRATGSLSLVLRSRVEPFKGGGDWQEVALEREFPVAETAIVLCDLWDKHWCRGATARCDAIAARVDTVVRAARAKGVLIVHAPSDCMDFYAGTPQRLRAQLAPGAEPPRPLDLTDPPLPIDDSDGGCDTDDPMYSAWTRQNPRIAIGEFDAVSDDGREIYNLFRRRGIKNVLVAGVHTNMCVLNRSFAIKQMTKWGFRCVLIRDLTDAMYDPKDPPRVSHDEGTELVIRHIEKYWAPTTTAAGLMKAIAP